MNDAQDQAVTEEIAKRINHLLGDIAMGLAAKALIEMSAGNQQMALGYAEAGNYVLDHLIKL